jgi:phenylacetate-CoA ligase
MRMFDRGYETMPRPELEQLQLERLQALMARLRRNVRRYREQIADVRVESLEDLAKLPLTTPEDIGEAFPYGLFALPLREVIKLHSILGPKGTPLVIGHTRNDLAHWGRLVARQLVASGVTANDVVQVCLGGSLCRGASGYVLGAEAIEASVIAEEPFHIDAQLAMLRNYRPTMLITTPTNALELMRTMQQSRIDPPSLSLRALLLSRPVDVETREQLSAGLLVAVHCNFGVDEILDPGLCVECEEGRFHVNEDQFLIEVRDGELIVTTLAREAMPLLRYRTRIACQVSQDRCPCGRTGVIIMPGGRLDQRLRVAETSLYDTQIAEVLQQTRAAGHDFTFKAAERRILVSIAMTEELFSDMMWPIENLTRDIESEFYARLGIEAEVTFFSPRDTSR